MDAFAGKSPRGTAHDLTTAPSAPSVAAALREIAAGRTTSEKIVRVCLDAIALREPDVQAWGFHDGDAALAQARQFDRAAAKGLLHGIPFGVKDIVDVAGWPTTFGSPIYNGYVSFRDAGCIGLLKEAGSICLGKTVSTELGHVFPGKTRNPHDLKRTPGGSSSGSAAAVAAGMIPFALGTQTTGSVLRPAAFCGVIGYKPTYGDIITSGVFPNSASFDTVGIMCREVEDLPLIRAALVRNPVNGAPLPSPSDLRIGVLYRFGTVVAEQWMDDLIADGARRLDARGASIADVELPAIFDRLLPLHREASGYEFARALTWERLNHRDGLSKALIEGRVRDGIELPVERYHAALGEIATLRGAFSTLMADYDVLILPSARGEAPLGLESTGDPAFNTPFSALHVPAVTLPLFQGPAGCPVGLQVVAAHAKDDMLLGACTAIWQALSDGAR
ncbi:amidase [Microbacteriaceae bacterium K1510]|nr:amidase [Microbacteriaceae bacterium K1510]